MNPITTIRLFKTVLGLSLALAIPPLQCAAQNSIPIQSRVPNMKSIADGNYLVTLDGGKLMNVEIKDGKATCVKASEAGLNGMQGFVRPLQSGVFLIRFENNRGTMSQVWIFRKDGTAAVREAPDAGELQSAIPVKDDSLVQPKKE